MCEHAHLNCSFLSLLVELPSGLRSSVWGSELHAPHRALSVSVQPRTHCTSFHPYLTMRLWLELTTGFKLEGKEGGEFLAQ